MGKVGRITEGGKDAKEEATDRGDSQRREEF